MVEGHPGFNAPHKMMLFLLSGLGIGLFFVLILGLIQIPQISPGLASLLSGSKLQGSFCSAMNSSTGKTSCSLAIGRVDDDQRIRDYFTKRDNIFASAERVINLTNVLKDGVIDWNNAKTPVQGAAAYDSFYANSRLYAIELDGMFSHIDANVDFLKANKIYFDSQGMDTQSEIDKMIDYKTSFKSSTIRTKSDVELMSQQLQLDAQKQQQTNDLLDTLSRLASEG